jgi:hypothetical protein
MMLSQEQLQELFSFCEKHFVQYYDVQVELVDHLANAIEAEMAANPKRSFRAGTGKSVRRFWDYWFCAHREREG